VSIYQYIDDILVGGDEVERVQTAQGNIISHLESLGLKILPEKTQTLSSEAKFLGIWWRGGMTCISPDTLSSLDQIKMPESKKDLQHVLGLLVFWRKPRIEWGFPKTGLSIHLGQKGPEGPTRPIGFYSRSFKDAEKRYTAWEKGLFVVSLALREAERTIRQQPIVLRGPFKVIKTVLAGTPPPDGVAQRASVRKWYAQVEHHCDVFTVSEGAVKMLTIRE
ncbi:hypothetical protein N327_04871, partial [Fulmarus glacialis]